MANDGKNRPPPSHHKEQFLVVESPAGTTKEEVKKEIIKALDEEPLDAFPPQKPKDYVIVVKNEGW
jgi:hypothetical protein